MTKTPQQKGKEFETEVQRAFEKRVSKQQLAVQRLYDTGSAGAFLPSQPGDLLLCYMGRTILVEVKSSDKHHTLSGKRAPLTSLFDDKQIAQMRLWYRAGAKVFVIFQSQKDKFVEVWDGNYIAHCYVTPRERAEPHLCEIFNPDVFDNMINYVLESV